MIYADLLNTVIAGAAVVTAVAAAVGVWKYRKDVRAQEKLRWQKTTVQAILQQTNEDISFEDLKVKYRSYAADHMRQKLGTDDISEEALRMILIDLCGENVIVQMGRDTYSLTKYLGQMQEMQSLQATFFEAQLEYLGKQDESIRQMIDQQRRMTDAIAPLGQNTNLKRVNN